MQDAQLIKLEQAIRTGFTALGEIWDKFSSFVTVSKVNVNVVEHNYKNPVINNHNLQRYILPNKTKKMHKFKRFNRKWHKGNDFNRRKYKPKQVYLEISVSQ